MTRRLLNLLSAVSLLPCVAVACGTACCAASGCARRAPDLPPGHTAPVQRVTLSDDELAEPPLAVSGVEELRRHVGRTVTLEGTAVSAWKERNELIVPHWAARDPGHLVHMGGLIDPDLHGRRVRVRITLREGEAVFDPGQQARHAAASPPTAATRPYRHRYRYLYPDSDAVLVGVWDGRQWQARREWLSPKAAARHRTARHMPAG